MYVVCAAIISTVLMLLAAPARASESRFVFVPQADSPGNDYLRLDQSSLEECQRKCDEQSACNAFTYNQRQGVCFLKRAASRVTKFYAFAVTGIKLAPSKESTTAGANLSAGSADAGSPFFLFSQTDSPGNDYSRIDRSSYETCRDRCEADDECNAFTYNHAHSVCFLKSAPNQRPTFYAWAITGVKQRVISPPAAPVQPQVEQAQTPPPAAPVQPQVEQAQTPPPAAPVQPRIEQTQSQGVGEVVVAEFSGKGMNTTRPFTVDGSWEVQWSSDDFIQIFLEKAEGGLGDLVANQAETGSGSSYQPRGGRYYLKVNALGNWRITVVAMKNPETGEGSSGGHTLDDNTPGTGPGVATPSEQVEVSQPPAAPIEQPVEQAQTPQPPAAPIEQPVEQAQTPQPPAAPIEQPVEPADERQFVAINTDKAAAFRAAPNDLAKGGTRNERMVELCKLLTSLHVRDWIGAIYQLSSNSEGKGVLAVKISDDVYIKTWNNSFSDISDHTLIDPTSSLFKTLSNLSEGARIKFSGSFLPSETDCIREGSLTLSGSMTEPEFLMQFERVQSAQ